MFKSLVGLAKDVTEIATKPVADAAKAVKEATKEITED